MRGHFGHLSFKTFPMTPRTPQGEVFSALLSNSKHSGVPKDSKSPTLGVGVSSSHFTQSKVATKRGIQIPYENKYFFTLILKSYYKQVERLDVWKQMGNIEKA